MGVLRTQRKDPPAQVRVEELGALDMKEGQPKSLYIVILSYPRFEPVAGRREVISPQ